MKKRIVLFAASALAAFWPAIARGDVIYDVDFENPPHIVDQQVTTGSGSDTPSFATSTVIVRNSPADFTSQAASLEPAGSFGFAASSAFSTGIALLSWDLAMISLGSSGPETAAISMSPSPGPATPITVFFMEDLSIEVSLGGLNPNDVGSFTLGQQGSFAFQIDLDNALYDFSLNGITVLNDQPLGAGWDLGNVNFSRDDLADPAYAVDNFQWQIIPEPSTVLLMLLGGVIFVVQQVRRNQ